MLARDGTVLEPEARRITMANAVGVYVCLTQGCSQRNVEVRHGWDESWTLAARQRRCETCRKRMLLVSVKRPLSGEVRRRLADLAEARKAKP